MTIEDAIKRLEKLKAIYSGMDIKSDIKALDMAIQALSAEKTAEWLQNPDDSAGCGYFICSHCECSVYDTEKYCPNCGAKMKESEEEE